MAEYLDVLRTEKKYVISLAAAGQIKSRLSYAMKPDPYCVNDTGYLVRSVYFDSLYNMDYQQKCSGLENRKKIRLRSYGHDSIIKLEWKQKQGAKQRKRSLPVSREQAESLLRGDHSWLLTLGSPLALEFYAMMTERVYLPRCLVEYQRFAYAEPTNDIRITLDSGISSHEGWISFLDQESPVYPVQKPDEVVLEVKYNHFMLDHIQTALVPFGLAESASSKYVKSRHFGLGVNAL